MTNEVKWFPKVRFNARFAFMMDDRGREVAFTMDEWGLFIEDVKRGMYDVGGEDYNESGFGADVLAEHTKKIDALETKMCGILVAIEKVFPDGC